MGLFDFVGDAWNWAKGAAGDVWGGVKSATDTDSSYTGGGANSRMKDEHFYYGGDKDASEQDAAYYRDQAQSAQARQGPQIDYGQTSADAAQQRNALGLMASAARGEQPSAAELQMRAGIGQATADQFALANSARGGGAAYAAAQQAAQRQAANLAQQGVIQGGAQRANEMAMNRGAYLQGAGQVRGMSAQEAQAQAGLNMQQRQANDAYAMQLEQQRRGVRQDQLNAYVSQEQLKQASAEGESGRKANQMSGLMSMGAGLVGTAAGVGSDARMKTGVQPAGLVILSDMTGKGAIQSPFMMSMDKYSDQNPSQGEMLALYGGKGNAAQQLAMRQQYGMTSDAREKTAAEAEGMRKGIMAALSAQGPSTQPENLARQYAETLVPYSYEYKDPSRAPNGQPGRHLGVMAQNVEKAPVVGEQIVQEGPDGKKMLNLPELTSANSAAIGDMHQRLKALEMQKRPDDQSYLMAFPQAARGGGY